MSRITKIVLAVLITLSLTLGGIILFANQPQINQPLKQKIFMPPMPTPTLTPTPTINTTSQSSPDGTIELKLQTKIISDTQTNYALSIKNNQQQTEQLIYTQAYTNSTKIILPFNTFSPDHQYFYVIEQTGLPIQLPNNYLVFQSSGKSFAETQFLNVTTYFIEKEVPFELDEVTGWAAPGLLLINTKQPNNNERGPSYWFEVYHPNFIQLSTRF